MYAALVAIALVLTPPPALQEVPQQGPPQPPDHGRPQGDTPEQAQQGRGDPIVTELPEPRPPEPRPLERVLVLEPASRSRRSPVVLDPVLAGLARADLPTPTEGGTLEVDGGRQLTWRALESAEGRYEDRALRGGWAYARLQSDQEEVLLLDAGGHSYALVDGVPRGGDPYDLGLVRTPIVVRPEGTDLLLKGSRGKLRATLLNPPTRVFLEQHDATLPDIVIGSTERTVGAVVIVNASNEVQRELFVTATAVFGEDMGYLSTIRIPFLHPLEVRKVSVPLPLLFEFERDVEQMGLLFSLHQFDKEANVQEALSQVRFELRVRAPDQPHKLTFESEIDGSIQYYAVRPATAAPEEGAPRPGLVLSLHGAGVEATGQAESYAPKDWAHVVAPTNRRPFGFDWEDWGRIDALEALSQAGARLGADPRRIHLTGHSMGGHGAWNLGAHYPHLFAAVAPSAGWSDFWSYGGAWEPSDGSPVEQMLARAANSSRTRLLLRNLESTGVYVLHGDADTNVPVAEARALREELGRFHPDFAYHERPGAGHWWGAECVDWPPLFDFLAERSLPNPQAAAPVRFTTVNPAVSSAGGWVRIEAQHRSLEPSTVEASFNAQAGRLEVATDNVALLLLDLSPLITPVGEDPAPLPAGQSFPLGIDGSELTVEWVTGATALLLLRRQPGGPWQPISGVAPNWKSSQRAGPFKDAFRKQMFLVYGTSGTPEENDWTLRKALYDLETWRYRANGSARLVSDTEVLSMRPHVRGEHNLIVYGNADVNAAWRLMSSTAPVEVRRGLVRVGQRRLERDDLAMLLVYPRADNATTSMAVICGSGPVGDRLTEQLPYFVSGVGYPDWTVFAPEMLERGGTGVLGAGFFGYDWSLGRGQSAWQEQVGGTR